MSKPANQDLMDDPGARNRDLTGRPTFPVERNEGYSSLGTKITNWTSNLLATAVVVVIALTFGSQLVSLWIPAESDSVSSTFNLSQSWPAIQACSLEFGDSPYRLTRETIEGTDLEVGAFLQACCRRELERGTQPVGEMGEQESKLINRSADREPIDQIKGKWRIFLAPKFEDTDALPLALGIRDDCRNSSLATPGRGNTHSRLVVWAMAMPGENGQWTTLVGQASTLDSLLDLDQLLPNNSKRTLTMTDPKGGSMIGFSGGEFASAITYYKDIAEELHWKFDQDPVRTENSWSARFLPPQESKITGIQVQLTLDHNESLTGILIVQSKDRLNENTDGIIQSPK